MTSEQLVSEGRKLQRPCVFLRPQGSGPVAAIWHEYNGAEVQSTGYHCWLTVDSRSIPDFPDSVNGYVSIFTNEEECVGGRVEVRSSWPERGGTQLYAEPASVLPPIEAVFLQGSDAVRDWIQSLGWKRTWRYNTNFKGADIVREYERVRRREYPLYSESDVFAVLGGWHWPCADDDWYDLLNERLLVLTVRDSEPWVEAWYTRSGEFKVIQRIT